MNRLMIIGNITRDPELRATTNGESVCTFTVAVNRRARQGQQPEADFFRVSAWRQLGENCQKYLAKGRKVCVVGPVSVHTYAAQDGSTRASLEVIANEVEFLSPAGQQEQNQTPVHEPPKVDQQTGMLQIETDELPF